jgi:hypothetical protein
VPDLDLVSRAGCQLRILCCIRQLASSFREPAASEEKTVSWLPKDKQFLLTRNGTLLLASEFERARMMRMQLQFLV